jgi:hypothetical protein
MEIKIPQSHVDDNYDALELFAEQIFIFLSLLALQRRLNCDETYILERASAVMSRVHPGADVPLLRRGAHGV